MIEKWQEQTIRAMRGHGYTIAEIAKYNGVSESTVKNVLRNKHRGQGQRKADRYEAVFANVGSGCYDGTHEMLTEEQLRAGDPLDLLITLEEIEERLDGTESN